MCREVLFAGEGIDAAAVGVTFSAVAAFAAVAADVRVVIVDVVVVVGADSAAVAQNVDETFLVGKVVPGDAYQ